MRTLIAIPRSLAFALCFYGMTVPWLIAALIALRLHRGTFVAIANGWSHFHGFCARWLAGQRVVVEGDLPHTPVFFVFKHESMFETMDLPRLLGMPMVVAKRELLELPVWGRLARAYGILPVDRAAGASALRQMRRDARDAVAAGRPLCLFPEGTRVPHGEAPPLKSGFAGLYSIMGLPVIPVAVWSGPLNPRGGFLRYAGIIRYRVGETIPPGLDRREAEARVHAAINALNSLP